MPDSAALAASRSADEPYKTAAAIGPRARPSNAALPRGRFAVPNISSRLQQQHAMGGEQAAHSVGHRHFCIRDLPIAGLAAKLNHGLDQIADAGGAPGIAVRQQAAMGVDWDPAIRLNSPSRNAMPALPLPAKPRCSALISMAIEKQS